MVAIWSAGSANLSYVSARRWWVWSRADPSGLVCSRPAATPARTTKRATIAPAAVTANAATNAVVESMHAILPSR
ncbi:hypothetical protein [Streptomyces sp. NPDC005799]|uniref:hypothetical protein n=1 Tax=Streptomyces sp. NPDC005799 TaxID=3154678 RepID=UPI0033FFD48B